MTTSKWIVFNNWSDDGPYYILITDLEWWDENYPAIDSWFCRNCPNCRPEPNDSVIRFNHQHQYVIWQMTWN